MQFKEVVGQADLKRHLIDLVNQNHLPHAMMMLGKEGAGGFPLTLALVQYLMCQNKMPNDSCGECSACIKMSKLQHPDVHFSFPTYKKDSTRQPVSNDFIALFRTFMLEHPYANDIEWLNAAGTEKQGNITAEECREIIQKLQLRSFEGGYKILVMWYPEYLGQIGNILLKLIEEPTAKTIIIFVANNLDNVLMTIQSRTQLFLLRNLDEKDIQDALIARNVNSEAALQMARLSEGNFNYAMHLMQHQEGDLIQLLRTWLNCLYANKGLDLVQWIAEIDAKNKEAQKKFLSYFIQLLEHAIRYKTIGASNLHLLEDEQKVVEILVAKGLSEYSIEKIAQMTDDSIYQIERNANTKILFHSLSLRIQQVIMQQKAIKLVS